MLNKFLEIEQGVLMTYDPEFTTIVERIRKERLERKAAEGTKQPATNAMIGDSLLRGSKMPRIDHKT